MQFIIESTSTAKANNKSYKSFFQERMGIVSVMVMNRDQAKKYPRKVLADADRKKYFGNRSTIKVITYEPDTSNNIEGSVRGGHDSGIF